MVGRKRVASLIQIGAENAPGRMTMAAGGRAGERTNADRKASAEERTKRSLSNIDDGQRVRGTKKRTAEGGAEGRGRLERVDAKRAKWQGKGG